MSASVGFTRSWSVGPYTVTLTAPKPRGGAAMSAVIEWSPEQPARLSEAELLHYRTGRDAALQAMATALGLRVAVVEA